MTVADHLSSRQRSWSQTVNIVRDGQMSNQEIIAQVIEALGKPRSVRKVAATERYDEKIVYRWSQGVTLHAHWSRDRTPGGINLSVLCNRQGLSLDLVDEHGIAAVIAGQCEQCR